MRQCLLVGYGNTLRRDDGLGPVIAAALRDAGGIPDTQMQVIEIPQLDITLAPTISESDLAIFVDARADDSEALVVSRVMDPDPDPPAPAHTSHSLSVSALLRMTLDWYGKTPRCYMVMPKGFDFSIGRTLSPQAEEAAAQAQTIILDLLRTG